MESTRQVEEGKHPEYWRLKDENAKLKTQLTQEQKSVNELSLAYQDLSAELDQLKAKWSESSID